MTKNKKQEILKWLKQLKRLSTTKIMGLTGSNLKYTIKYLNELEKENKVVKEKETVATYWRLK